MILFNRVVLLPVVITLLWSTNAVAQQSELDKQIQHILEESLTENELPGIVAAIAKNDKLIASAAAGLRKMDADSKISIEDKMHLGSCTKAMTATLAALQVQDKKLSWDSTIAETLPELGEKIHADFSKVTLLDLLRHQSGMPGNAANWWKHRGDDISETRLKIAIESLADKPVHAPGTKYLYSNLGYMVAGLMIEQVTGQTWEQAMKQRLFEPLKMESAGFGSPGTKDKTDQPWGHQISGEKVVALQHDNAPSLGPAGTVHCSLADWAKFIALHFDGRVDGKVFLSRKSLEILHKPTLENYALGWIVVERPWANGVALTHAGSNTLWYCVVWAAPENQKTYFAAMNIANSHSAKAADKIVSELIKLDRNN